MNVPAEYMDERRRKAFLMAHDHLISPWKYHPIERMERDQLLRKANWQRNETPLTETAFPPK